MSAGDRPRCVPLGTVPAERYDALVGDSFFASRGFAALWAARGGRPVAWIAGEPSAPRALLPGVEIGRGPFARFQSMPDGCYGGLFVEPAREPERPALAAALLGAIAGRGYVRARVHDFHRTLPERPGLEPVPCSTRLVEIGPGWAPPDPGLRGQIRKAERDGVRAERFDWDRHGGAFLDLVRRSARRRGTRPRYDAAFYRALAALAGRDPRVLWLWCERDGAAVASHVYFLERGALQAWQSHLDRSFPALKAAQLLRAVAVRAALARGAVRLNLGSTPPGAAGLASYKARWGGVPVAYPSYVHEGALGFLARRLRRPWAERDPRRARPAGAGWHRSAPVGYPSALPTEARECSARS